MSGPSKTQKLALVAGANKGIGFHIARHLGQKGLVMLMGCRDESRGTQAARELRYEGLDVEFLVLDVVDDLSVAAAARHVSANHSLWGG